jgi:hypothetical protein
VVARSLEHAGLAKGDEVGEVVLGIWTKDAEKREGVQLVGIGGSSSAPISACDQDDVPGAQRGTFASAMRSVACRPAEKFPANPRCPGRHRARGLTPSAVGHAEEGIIGGRASSTPPATAEQ